MNKELSLTAEEIRWLVRMSQSFGVPSYNTNASLVSLVNKIKEIKEDAYREGSCEMKCGDKVNTIEK
jgi:hypothetical protein